MILSFRCFSLPFALAALIVAGCGGTKEPVPTPEAASAPPAATATPSADSPAMHSPGVGTSVPADSLVNISPGGLPDSVRKYEVRSAIVEYWNSWLDRRQVLYVDEYGAREAFYTAPELGGGGAAPPYDVSVYADGWRYDYSTITRAGTRQEKELASGPLLGVVQDVWALPEPSQEQFGLKRLGRKKIAGKDAIGYSFQFNGTTTVWLWKGLPLHVEMVRGVQGGGMATITFDARRIEANVAVPAEKFQVPPDIAWH